MVPRWISFGMLLAAGGIAIGATTVTWGQQSGSIGFVRADANGDGERDLADVLSMLWCSFLATKCSTCADAADVDDSGKNDLGDPVSLISFLFLGGPSPSCPGGSCGPDQTADELDCQSFPRCQDAISTSRGDLYVTPIDHATVVLEWDKKTIYVDPVGGAARFRDFPAPDLIFVTHTHGDHMEASTIRAVANAQTVLVVPKAVSDALPSSGLEEVEERVLANGEKVEVEGIEVEAVPMYNLTSGRLRYHAKGQGNGYVLDLAGTHVYISGDTEDIPEMRMLTDIDLAFLCMNLPFTMTPAQATSAVLEFRPRVVYPYHYRGQDPEQFKSLVEVESDDIEVRVRDWYP